MQLVRKSDVDVIKSNKRTAETDVAEANELIAIIDQRSLIHRCSFVQWGDKSRDFFLEIKVVKSCPTNFQVYLLTQWTSMAYLLIYNFILYNKALLSKSKIQTEFNVPVITRTVATR